MTTSHDGERNGSKSEYHKMRLASSRARATNRSIPERHHFGGHGLRMLLTTSLSKFARQTKVG